MFSLSQGEKLVSYARCLVDNHVKNIKKSLCHSDSFFKKNRGVFITLHTYPDHNLRGCIGIPEPVMLLEKAIKEAAVSATHDPRFNPLGPDELSQVIVEVTVLTPPEFLAVENPKEYLSKIIVGKHGLIIRRGGYSGLLLPQVPVEQGWEVEEFLAQTCYRAWLPPDAWTDPQTTIFIFTGQIFTETEPYGPVREKSLA